MALSRNLERLQLGPVRVAVLLIFFVLLPRNLNRLGRVRVQLATATPPSSGPYAYDAPYSLSLPVGPRTQVSVGCCAPVTLLMVELKQQKNLISQCPGICDIESHHYRTFCEFVAGACPWQHCAGAPRWGARTQWRVPSGRRASCTRRRTCPWTACGAASSQPGEWI
jgi:hypothetical protein